MSRSGYTEGDDEDGRAACWRGAVRSAIRGQRGQMFLLAMLTSLDSMLDKRLIAHDLVTPEGECCALGAAALHCGISVADLDESDPGDVAERFGIAMALAAEIAYENDEGSYAIDEEPERRWTRMRAWVVANISPPRFVADGAGP